jgi:hypothetical protein
METPDYRVNRVLTVQLDPEAQMGIVDLQVNRVLLVRQAL